MCVGSWTCPAFADGWFLGLMVSDAICRLRLGALFQHVIDLFPGVQGVRVLKVPANGFPHIGAALPLRQLSNWISHISLSSICLSSVCTSQTSTLR